ncbi:MAG: 5'-methylthioadenosine/S-adenosylhomocysteine nucleosidase, partial [Clostridiales bacterium]|nr:5'-methylthioadenosine/S-adenosylhomocysteine nucleosidase [Clostridiales bacterium]
MKRIGMVVAVEIDAVLKRYGEPISDEVVCGFQLLTYKSGENKIYVMNCGMGEIAAAAGTQLLISVYKVDVMINFGVVGGLTDEMALAKTCIVEKVVHYGFDGSQGLHHPQGQYPGTDSLYFEADKNLIGIAKKLYPDLKTVTCASADNCCRSKR